MTTSCVDVITKALARSDARENQNRRGAVHSSLNFFSRTESEPHAPPIVPLNWVRLPDPLAALQREAKASSVCGLFTSVGRAWIAVDNRFYLWSLRDRTFTFVDTPYGVVRDAVLLRCPQSLFGRGIHHAVALTTENAVTLHGLAFEEAPATSNAQFVEEPCSLGTDASITKIAQHSKTGRIFAVSSNGNLYELQIGGNERSISWINASVLFSGTPVLQAVGEFLTNMQRSWSTSHSPLIDLAVDDDKALLYTLSAKGHIDMWSIKQEGLGLICTAEHSLAKLKATIKSGPPATLPHLKSIHVTSGRRLGCLTAISREGDRYVFATQVQRWDISGGQALVAVERIAAPMASSWAVAKDDIYIAGSHERTVVVSTPCAGFPTLNGALEGVSEFASMGNRCHGFDLCDSSCSNDLTRSQFYSGPSEMVLLTNLGALVLLRLRPIDIAVSLLSDNDIANAVKSLDALGSSESCAVLIAIAAGCVPSTLTFSDPHDVFDPVCRLIMARITTPVPSEIVRRILSHLRELNHPLVAEAVGGSQSTWTITFSAFVAGMTTALARSLNPVWSEPLLHPKKKTLQLSSSARKQANSAVAHCLRLLELCRDEFWYATSDPPNCSPSLSSATFASATPVHAAVFDQIQSARVTGLHRLASISLQVLRFCDFVADISPSIVALAAREAKDKVSFSFRDVVDAPTKLADFGRQVLKIVVDTERAAGVPNYDRLLELFDDMERDCRDIFCHADSVANQATLELDQLKRLNDQGLYVDGVETTVARLKANAAAIFSTGAIDRVCAQLLDVGAVQGALEVLLAAADQLKKNDPEKAYWTNTSNQTLESKTALVAKVATILERVWRSQDRALFFALLQEPGYVWIATGDDAVTHYLLLDWLTSPRLDPSLTRDLRRTVSMCPSKWLEQYLQRNVKRLALETAEYYRFQRRDLALACRAYLAVAEGTLPHIAPKDRVLHRAHRTMDALVCAREAGLNPAEISRIATQHEALEIQNRLANVIKRYLDSNAPSLNASVEVDGATVTQRQACDQHLASISDRILAPEELFAMATFYRSIGGVEIQLRILAAHHVADQDLYAAVIGAAFSGQVNAAQTSEELLVYRESSGFPLHIVIAHALIAKVASLDQILLEKAGIPLDEALAAVKVLIDGRIGAATKALQLPQEVFTLPIESVVELFVSIIVHCTQQRRGSAATLAAHVRAVKALCQKLGLPVDERLAGIEDSLEDVRMRNSRHLNGTSRW